MIRTTLLLVFAAATFASCKKTDPEELETTAPPRTGPSVSQQNLSAGLTAGTTLRFNGVYSNGGGALHIPNADTGQTLNFAAASIAFQDSMVLGPTGNAAFPTANFSRLVNINFGNGTTMQTIAQTHYYEITSNGWSELGYSMPAFMISYPGVGTITYAAQSDLYTPTKLPMTPPLPMYIGDSVNYNTVITENSSANAPTYFINNAPAAQKYTYSGKVKVIGSGNLSLPGFSSPLPALIVRRDQTIKLNFLLNGATPDPLIMSAIGVQDGQTTTTTYYDFYHRGNLGYLGVMAVQNGAISYTLLRKP